MRLINAFFLLLLAIFVTSLIVGCSPSNTAQLPQNPPQVSDQNQQPVPDSSAASTPTIEGQNSAPNPTSPSSSGYNNSINREAMLQNSINACNGMNVNDSCQLTFGNRTITGTCRSFNDTLSCAPTGGSRMRGSGNYTRGSGNYTRYQGNGQ